MSYPASDPRSSWNDPNAAGTRRADQLVAQAANRPAWMSNYRVPSQVTGSGSVDTVRDLVGMTIILMAVEPATSQSKGAFTRWTFQPVDPGTGELIGTVGTMVAFAQPVVRFAHQLAGGKLESMLVLNPPVVVSVQADGDVIYFADP